MWCRGFGSGRIGLAVAMACGMPAYAEDIKMLDAVEIKAQIENLVGVADSANQGTVTKTQLDARTAYRPGELLESTPGLVVTQHSGEGKANQFYLRGFNLDHGTDLRTTVDGMLVNQRSHAHGQGWTDLNFLIPELVTDLRYKKGPYNAEEGDFSAAGAVSIDYVNSLPQRMFEAATGENGYYRLLAADSPRVGAGRVLYALEFNHNDGPYTHGDNYRKYNGVARYSEGDNQNGFNVTAMAYTATWHATDQIPQRAVTSGLLGRFDTFDPSDGGDAQRYSLSTAWRRTDNDSVTRANAYVLRNQLHLFSNFTYDSDPLGHRDQFTQPDARMTYAANLQRVHYGQLLGKETEFNVGAQAQHDEIDNALQATQHRQVWQTIRTDRIRETSLAVYGSANVRLQEKMRSSIGLRGDIYRFDVRSDTAANSGTAHQALLSPKLAFIFGPWRDTEYYLNAGGGYHSNDARGATINVDPVDKITAVAKVDPLVRAWGYEAGARTAFLPGLQSTVSAYLLDFDSELLFVGDAGTTEAGRPSRRIGVEFTNAYAATRWLTLDADVAYAHARFRDDVPGEGRYIDGAVEGVATLAAGVDHLGDFFGGVQWRYFGPRPLTTTNSVRSRATPVLNGHVGYKFNKQWNAALEIFNVLNQQVNSIDYYYYSQLPGEPLPVPDTHFHPLEPRSVRVAVRASF